MLKDFMTTGNTKKTADGSILHQSVSYEKTTFTSSKFLCEKSECSSLSTTADLKRR